MAIVVLKFGGSSVATSGHIKRVAKRIVEYHSRGKQVVVVVSARGDTTDDLIASAKEVSTHLPSREMDMLLSTGEQISIALLTMAILELGCSALSFTGLQAGIITDSVHGKAKITDIKTDRLLNELNSGKIVVVAGFQGVSPQYEITTLGRGGSDTTAVALAAALKAEVCEIFTDVDGVYTADPRVVASAKKLKEISFEEMLELASLGAQVLQPRAVEFGMQYRVPIHVRSSFNYNEGTIVKEVEKMEQALIVSGITYDYNTAKISLFDVPDRPGIAKTVFKALAQESINVDMIIQSTMRDELNDISFTVTENDLAKAVTIMERIKHEVNATSISFDANVSKISIVGAGMISNAGVAATMFEALADAGINIQMISTSEIKISCIIGAWDTEKAVKVLHEKFNLQYVS
ncbi:MAG: aspartate kinase [Bacillota bacterium]